VDGRDEKPTTKDLSYGTVNVITYPIAKQAKL
jgi:hypothetical protein